MKRTDLKCSSLTSLDRCVRPCDPRPAAVQDVSVTLRSFLPFQFPVPPPGPEATTVGFLSRRWFCPASNVVCVQLFSPDPRACLRRSARWFGDSSCCHVHPWCLLLSGGRCVGEPRCVHAPSRPVPSGSRPCFGCWARALVWRSSCGDLFSFFWRRCPGVDWLGLGWMNA